MGIPFDRRCDYFRDVFIFSDYFLYDYDVIPIVTPSVCLFHTQPLREGGYVA